MRIKLLVLAAALVACGAEPSGPMTLPQRDSEGFRRAQAALVAAGQRVPRRGRARGVVLFIGDGMDIATVTAARIRAGQLLGKAGEEHALSWEGFPHVALAKTYNTNQQVPDSAGTATAMLSGVKTKAGVLGVDASVTRGECRSAAGSSVTSLLELAEREGLSTGVVSTARITHATPAAAYAHTPERGWEHDAALREGAAEAGCVDIARQLVEFSEGDGIEVALGGGRLGFVPRQAGGKRADGRDLTRQWAERGPGWHFVSTQQELEAAIPTARHVLGLFAPSHMDYEADRRPAQPSLAAMTRAAIGVLRRNPRGYFLLVEAGRIDHAHHQGNAYRALHETIAFSDAIEAAVLALHGEEVLLIVTADHGHTMTISGYPTRGNPILGVVLANGNDGEPRDAPALAGDAKPYTTLGYMNGPGAVVPTREGETLERPTIQQSEHPDYLQQALFPVIYRLPNGTELRAETHGGQDVAIWAEGPSAYLFQGTVEQNYVFHVMAHALHVLE